MVIGSIPSYNKTDSRFLPREKFSICDKCGVIVFRRLIISSLGHTGKRREILPIHSGAVHTASSIPILLYVGIRVVGHKGDVKILDILLIRSCVFHKYALVFVRANLFVYSLLCGIAYGSGKSQEQPQG